MGVKVKVAEVAGNASDIETAITSMIGAVTIAAGTVPAVAVAGSIPRFEVIFVYRES